MEKRVLGFTFTLASIAFVVGACSSSDNSGIPSPGGEDASPRETGTPDSSDYRDANPSEGGDDASKDAGSDAKPIDAPEVTLKYGSCPTFTACGGNPQGTWKYAAGGCVDELSVKQCPSLTVKSSEFKIRGIVTIGATTLERESEAKLSATVNLPGTCTGGLSCNLVEIGLKNPPGGAPGFDTATCTPAGGGCDCAVTKTVVDDSSTTYTVAGSKITTADKKTYDFCVDTGKSTFTYEDELAGLASATFVMNK